MAVSCIIPQPIVYQPVDGPSSVSKSAMKSLSHMRSLACGSRLKNWALGSGVCINTYRGGTPFVSELWVLSPSSGGAGGVPGLTGAGHGQGAPVPFAPPLCPWIRWCAILARRTAVHLTFPNHCWWLFYHSLHHVMTGKRHTPSILFSDFGAWSLNELLRFVNCCAWKPSFGYFGQIQGKMHVGLFKIYLTSLSCHRSWHGENLQELCCCL